MMDMREWLETDKKQKAEIDRLKAELGKEKAKTDIDLVNDPLAWDRLARTMDERDEWKDKCWAKDRALEVEKRKTEEWKRRAKVIWEEALDDILRDQYMYFNPEAREWFTD